MVVVRLIAFLVFAITGFASHVPLEQSPPPTPEIPNENCECQLESPWFTGPLLTPSGHIVPIGYINVEPYFFFTVTDGLYDNDWDSTSLEHNLYNAQFQLPLFIGLTNWANILFVGQAGWNNTRGVSNLNFGDFLVELDVAIYKDTLENCIPGLKLYVQEVFPTGRFDELDPQNFGTDIGGRGAYKTTFGFVVTRTFHIYCDHFLSTRFNGFYIAPSKVCVKGFNTYGGAPDTDGFVRPGPCFGALFAFEYNFTRNWAFAMDFQALYEETTKFTGRRGTLDDGSPAIGLDLPVSFQFTVAPAIEYNFNGSLGIIGGAWFSLAGKNTGRFYSAVIAINYYGPIHKSTRREFRTSGGGSSPSTGGGGFGGGF